MKHDPPMWLQIKFSCFLYLNPTLTERLEEHVAAYINTRFYAIFDIDFFFSKRKRRIECSLLMNIIYKILRVLIDSGSTNRFLDKRVAEELKLSLKSAGHRNYSSR